MRMVFTIGKLLTYWSKACTQKNYIVEGEDSDIAVLDGCNYLDWSHCISGYLKLKEF